MATDVKKIDGKTCVSTSLLCEAFGVSRQAVNEWNKRGCPKASRGYWCLTDVIAWREGERKKDTGNGEVEKLPLTAQKIYWETRCREAQVEAQQFKNAVLRGDYLEKAQADKELRAFFVVLKQSALSLPRKVAITAAQYVGNDRARHLENETREVIEDVLAQWSTGKISTHSGLDPHGDDSAEATRKNHRKSVGGRKPPAGSKN